MEVEANIYVEEEVLEEAEGRLQKNLKQLQQVPRNMVLAYAGFWGMAYDEAKALLDRSRKIFDEAEDRGEALESETVERVRNLYQRAEAEVEEEVQEQMGEVLEELEVPTEERINRLSLQIDALDRKLDVIVAQETAVEAEVGQGLGRLQESTQKRLDALEEKLDRLSQQMEQVVMMEAEEEVKEPIPGYDELTAREVVKRLPGLNMAQLVAVRHYEAAQENRVTVLRAVDERLEAMPIAHYDELTVEEVEPLLSTLDAAELSYLAEYEAAHENRVTLLRAVEAELEERTEA